MKKYQMPKFAVVSMWAINLLGAIYCPTMIVFNEWPTALLLAVVIFWANWFIYVSFKEEKERFEASQALQQKLECAHHNKHIVHKELTQIVYLCEDCGEKIYQSNC